MGRAGCFHILAPSIRPERGAPDALRRTARTQEGHPMHIVAAGLSFRSAPLTVRERAVVPEGETARLLRYLVGHCGLRGAVVLSTCNRTEFYVSCATTALADDVRPRLAMYLDPAGGDDIAQHLFDLRDGQAIRHMLRVAAGLESMVIGEPQVLGQFREAHRAARSAATLDARLDYVMRRAVSAGKRVRAETALGQGAGTIADAAVELAREVIGDVAGRRVLVLGAGAMSTVAVRRLHEAGAVLAVASRGTDSAIALVAQYDRAVAVADPASAAAAVDVILTCTDSAETVLSAADVAAIQQRRGGRPLLIIDIAVPRDVDPAAAGVTGVTLLDVDALDGRAVEPGGVGHPTVAEATAIIEAEVAHTIAVVSQRDTAGPTIAALVQQAEAIRRREVERTMARMPGVDSATAKRVDTLTRSIVSRILHAPIAHLREFADDPGVALTLRDAFDVDALDAAIDAEAGGSVAAS